MPSIRTATPRDVPGIATVVEQVFGEVVELEYCRQLISRGQQYVYVAVDAASVLGFVSAFLSSPGDTGHRWEVDLLAVRQSNQRNGLGLRLLHASSEQAHAANAVSFSLYRIMEMSLLFIGHTQGLVMRSSFRLLRIKSFCRS